MLFWNADVYQASKFCRQIQRENNVELNADKSCDSMKKTSWRKVPLPMAQGLELDGREDLFQHKLFFDPMILE